MLYAHPMMMEAANITIMDIPIILGPSDISNADRRTHPITMTASAIVPNAAGKPARITPHVFILSPLRDPTRVSCYVILVRHFTDDVTLAGPRNHFPHLPEALPAKVIPEKLSTAFNVLSA